MSLQIVLTTTRLLTAIEPTVVPAFRRLLISNPNLNFTQGYWTSQTPFDAETLKKFGFGEQTKLAEGLYVAKPLQFPK